MLQIRRKIFNYFTIRSHDKLHDNKHGFIKHLNEKQYGLNVNT